MGVEVWRKIPGTYGRYEVSSMGRVRNRDTQKILKETIEKDGRVRVSLQGYKRGSYYVAKLVQKAFLPEGRIYHKDNNQQNNSVNNLEVR